MKNIINKAEITDQTSRYTDEGFYETRITLNINSQVKHLKDTSDYIVERELKSRLNRLIFDEIEEDLINIMTEVAQLNGSQEVLKKINNLIQKISET